MFDFLKEMDPLQKGFWYVALFASVVFILQSLMTLFGGGHDIDGTTADFDGDLNDTNAPFQLFSFRNLINFLLGFGWAGASFYTVIENRFLLIFVAVIIGCAFVGIFFLIIRQLLKLSEDNTFKIGELSGKTGQVYVPIPGKMTGSGQVQISARGAVHELKAMTEELEKIPTGTTVTVERIQQNTLIVKRLNN